MFPTRSASSRIKEAVVIQRLWRGFHSRRISSDIIFRLLSEQLQESAQHKLASDESSDTRPLPSKLRSPRPPLSSPRPSPWSTSLEEAILEAGRVNRIEEYLDFYSSEHDSPDRPTGQRHGFEAQKPQRVENGLSAELFRTNESNLSSNSGRDSVAIRDSSVIEVDPELAEEVVCKMSIEALHEVSMNNQ